MKDIAKRVFEVEIESLQHVVGLIDDAFTAVVEALLNSTGKVIVIGVGKSGLIGKKIATPFASTAHYSLLNALKLNGISEKDVELLDMQPADIYAAWQRGDIDAAYVWEPTLANLLSDGKILLSSADKR